MFCISLGSVSHPEPSPSTRAAAATFWLPRPNKQDQLTPFRILTVSLHRALQRICFQQCLVQIAELHSVVQAESLFIWALCYISPLVPMCLTPVNHPLTSKWESLVGNIYGCLYTMPRRKNTSAHYFYRNKNTQKPDRTHNCIS